MTGCTVRRYDQLETSPETIEQELRPAVCECRQTDRQTDLWRIIVDDDDRAIRKKPQWIVAIYSALRRKLTALMSSLDGTVCRVGSRRRRKHLHQTHLNCVRHVHFMPKLHIQNLGILYASIGIFNLPYFRRFLLNDKWCTS